MQVSLRIDYLAEILKLQYLSLAFIASSLRVTEKNLLFETAVWPTLFLSNVFTALKGSHFYILSLGGRGIFLLI